MAKDDYNVLTFKILLYLYGSLKRKYVFQKEAFYKALGTEIPEEYLTDILRYMSGEGLIEGAEFTRVWGNEYILLSPLDEMRITPAGTVYLQENSTMKKVKDGLLANAGIIVELIKLVL